VQGVSPLPAGGMLFAGGTFRGGPGKVCRNSLAGLVMLPGLEFWAGSSALFVTRPGSKRCLARSDSRQPLPGPPRNVCGGKKELEEKNVCMGCRGRVPCPPEACFSREARSATERLRRSGESDESTVNGDAGDESSRNFCCSCNVYLAADNAGFMLDFLLATPF